MLSTKKYINKYLNIKIASYLLIVWVFLASVFSSNPRASFFYGGVLDHNLVLYLFFGIFLYFINVVWARSHEKTRKVFFLIPIVSTLLASILLYFDFFKKIMDWSYLSSISIFSILGALLMLFKYKQLWKKALALVLLSLSIVIFLSGEMGAFTPQTIQTKVTNKFMTFYAASFNDVRPNMTASWGLTKQSFLENKMLGIGPNQFSNVWMKYRPASSMTDVYYNTNIENASSSFFKLLIEMGLAAILILFVTLFKLIDLFKEAKRLKGKVAMHNLLHMLYITVATIMIIFVSNDILFLMYYISLLYIPSRDKSDNIYINNDTNLNNNNETFNDGKKIKAKKSRYIKYISYIIFCLLGLLLILKYISYKMIDTSILRYDKDKDVKALLNKIDLANKLYPNNFANSLKSRIYLQQATDLYLGTTKEQRDQKLMSDFKALISMSLAEADLSVYKNLSNPYVYINRASIYEAASVLDNNYYYDLASADYNKAITLDPYNPDNMLSLSKLEYAKGMKDKTGILIDKMLAIKPNYLPAYLTLADMMELENNRNKKAYVLQEALKANHGNQNVAYMLAIEYFKLGLYKDYILLMEELIKLNPNIEQLKKELEQVKEIANDKDATANKDVNLNKKK